MHELLLRLAPGSEPKTSVISGVSVKFLADGEPSRNYLACGNRVSSFLANIPMRKTRKVRLIRWLDGDLSNSDPRVYAQFNSGSKVWNVK